ncbi:ABC transporter permease [[Clostridium] fimetarium]|uniref:Putative ABC transport system permease protein n=1 Tax=[Clostridium] fimetarium TaxID=99656 RepID=A0A1I0PDH8_9FIRM|nr:FtsX-like permease family protein [[Clostridium] fimetarium]SEW12460.1 putative ABC transport system permease protein [[Clostridium] fimetarium]
MNKIWMHAIANIRKTKSASTTLVIMFVIAALLFNSGLLVVVNYGSFFNNLKDELKPSSVYFAIPDKIYTDEVKTYIDENEHVEQTQTNEVVVLDANILSKGEDKSFPIMFSNMDEKREISKWKFVGEHLSAEDMSVYVPDIFKAVSGYQLNDKIKINYTDEETKEVNAITFTVKGYTEDIYFSSTDTGYLSFYLPQDTYNKVKAILNKPEYLTHVVFANLDNVKNASSIESGIREILNLNSASLMAADPSTMLVVIDLELIELSRCMMASMISAMMVMFAIIIVIVCLLVVRFRIVNSIEEDVMKIGSLKSVGYTSRQIILSVMLQFLLIAGIGSFIGCALSYPTLPAVAAVFEQQSGLKWEQGFDGGVTGSAFIILLLIVILIAYLAAHRISKLNPINALRGETSERKYKRNHLQLENTRGNLPLILALRTVLQGMKQNIMIIVILIAVTFSGAFGVIMYYNTTIDTKAFEEVPGMEICNAIAVLNPVMDQTEVVDTIKNMDNVRNVQYLEEVKIKVEGMEVAAYVMDDYSKKETMLVYEGRYPQNNNEISLAGILAQRLEKTIGDTVTVRFGENEEKFKVVGLSNGSQMGGLNSSILAKDYVRLNPNFKHQSLYIYLDKGTDAAKFVTKLESKFDKSMLLTAVDFDKGMAEGMASYQKIVAAMGLAMLIITLFVVTLVLYFVISSSVIRKKRELGIQKAIGFTTYQLMSQLSISFTIPIMIGVVIGTLLGASYTNSLMSLSMKGAGIMKAGFIVDPYWIIAFGAATIVFSYLLSMLITWRIRKISAYALVTE